MEIIVGVIIILLLIRIDYVLWYGFDKVIKELKRTGGVQ